MDPDPSQTKVYKADEDIYLFNIIIFPGSNVDSMSSLGEQRTIETDARESRMELKGVILLADKEVRHTNYLLGFPSLLDGGADRYALAPGTFPRKIISMSDITRPFSSGWKGNACAAFIWVSWSVIFY